MTYRPARWPKVVVAVLLPPVILLVFIVGTILFVANSVN